MYIGIHDMYISIYDYNICTHLTVCQNVFFLVWLIDRNSMRAASYLNLKNVTYLDNLKSARHVLAFGGTVVFVKQKG
jgi:hypothetical protein